MDRFLVVFRGAAIEEAEEPEDEAEVWDGWFHALGSALVDRGALSYGSVEVHSRLVGPKLSSSALSGYAIIAAADFDDAVRIVQTCPIFDEKGSVEIAHLRQAASTR
jgi:hypothetical protein